MRKKQGHRPSRLLVVLLSGIVMGGVTLFAFVPMLAQASDGSFLGQFHTINTLASTLLAGNGKLEPGGLVVVPSTQGQLTQGNILVSGTDESAHQQGTTSTIMQITPDGQQTLFAHLSANQLPGSCPGGLGLTTALVALQRGWVIVGNLPPQVSSSTTAQATTQAGCLIVLNSAGQAVETLTGELIDGPWAMTVADFGNQAALFVTNVLNGVVADGTSVVNNTVAGGGNSVNKGTVVRIMLDVPQQGQGIPHVNSTTLIGSGFSAASQLAASILGPTGIGLGRNDILYVADTLNHSIDAIPNALNRQTAALATGDVITNNFVNGPLGMAIDPNGNILTINGGSDSVVEIAPTAQQPAIQLPIALPLLSQVVGTTQVGQQLAAVLLGTIGAITSDASCLTGLTLMPNNSGVYFMNNCTDTLSILH